MERERGREGREGERTVLAGRVRVRRERVRGRREEVRKNSGSRCSLASSYDPPSLSSRVAAKKAAERGEVSEPALLALQCCAATK